MVGGIEGKLPAFVADMEEPCLVGLDSLVQSAALVDSRRMQMQDAAEQVKSPVMSPDVEDERLELHCQVVRKGEVADATVRARERQAVMSSCSGEVVDATGTARGRQAAASYDGCEMDGDVGEASPALSPRVVDLEVCSSTKQTPGQVVKLEKQLMEHEDVFSRDAQGFGCTSLV
ncbi:hypothetical protein E2C01_028060 [Portunus trituberculatus]|uniref:Uncharacterized protein n=1 Tax=Portunus trituberculatus TaxID=210409 RepID=A0A5B7EQL8_PORTR|nr:hypothetical protein [Portunus trituberculatus]